jgi:hypothetical protein
MIQLSYQAALDPFHALFRLLRLWPILNKGPLPRDTVRILDFYLLFPFRIGDIRIARPHLRYKRLAKTYANTKPYGEQPEGRALLNRMEPMQNAALNTLAANGLIDPARLLLGEVRITDALIPEDIAPRVKAANDSQADLMEFLGILGSDYNLLGTDGLKDRTGLLEYRYDPV